MLFPTFIKWLAKLPASYALGLLWWAEITVILCSLAGGYLFSAYLFDYMPVANQKWLFAIALLTYLVVYYFIHLVFTKISQLKEMLIDIHRRGGLIYVESLIRKERIEKIHVETAGGESEREIPDISKAPGRISASADAFRFRYFVVLPSALALYLLGFTSTIYRIFTRQILTWEPGYLVVPALATAIIGCLCFVFIMPLLPGYVSIRKLIGYKTREGEH